MKRFYATAHWDQAADGAGYRILLDGRPVRTPGKRQLAVPSQALAEAVAAEWAAQGATITPATMPLTRILNSALDGVVDRAEEVRADIVRYAGGDLVFYRAEHPAELVRRQAEAWDPIIGWVEREIGGLFRTATGIVAVSQPEETLARLSARLAAVPPLALAGLHVMTSLTGSALIAYATWRGHLGCDAAWDAAHVDEDWQISQWGADAEAAERRALRHTEMRAAWAVACGCQDTKQP